MRPASGRLASLDWSMWRIAGNGDGETATAVASLLHDDFHCRDDAASPATRTPCFLWGAGRATRCKGGICFRIGEKANAAAWAFARSFASLMSAAALETSGQLSVPGV